MATFIFISYDEVLTTAIYVNHQTSQGTELTRTA